MRPTPFQFSPLMPPGGSLLFALSSDEYALPLGVFYIGGEPAECRITLRRN